VAALGQVPPVACRQTDQRFPNPCTVFSAIRRLSPKAHALRRTPTRAAREAAFALLKTCRRRECKRKKEQR
jgi:hypothetical protein